MVLYWRGNNINLSVTIQVLTSTLCMPFWSYFKFWIGCLKINRYLAKFIVTKFAHFKYYARQCIFHLIPGALLEIRNGGLLSGSEDGAPSRRRLGVWGRSHLLFLRRPQRSKILHFFCKNYLILGLFKKEITLLKRGINIGSANKVKLVALMGHVADG